MKVLNNRTCSFCNETKTCYVFSGFDSMFSACMDCFEELELQLSFTEEFNEVCSLCDQRKMVKEVEFPKSLYYTVFRICNTCNNNIKGRVETSTDTNFQ